MTHAVVPLLPWQWIYKGILIILTYVTVNNGAILCIVINKVLLYIPNKATKAMCRSFFCYIFISSINNFVNCMPYAVFCKFCVCCKGV